MSVTIPKAEPFAAEGPKELVRETPPGENYPVAALGPLREAVEAVQGMTQAPVAIPAASALAVASLALQGFADVETLGGRRPLSLYALTIAQSGERKSSCDSLLMTALLDHERTRATAHREEIARWDTACAIRKGERERILKSVKDRDKAQDAIEALGPELRAPANVQRIVTEPTYEGLTRLFVQGQPSLGIFSDEGGQFLGGHAMNSDNRQKTLSALNDLWQGNPIRRTRQGEGSFVLYGRRLAMHLMVQPVVARAFMADPMSGDTGFLPRFLICEPPSTIGSRLHAQTKRNDAAIDRFFQQIRAILDTALPMDEDTRELTPRLLPLSDEARALLIDFSDVVEVAQRNAGEFEHFRGYASKAAEQAARIAGVQTLFDDPCAGEVPLEAMAQGIELSQFYLSEARRLGDAAIVSASIDQADRLRRWLCNEWPDPDITLTEVLQRAPVRTLRERPAAKAAIATLVEAGWLVPLEPGTMVRGKPRKEAYRFVGRPDAV